jgi:hypothetical protein
LQRFYFFNVAVWSGLATMIFFIIITVVAIMAVGSIKTPSRFEKPTKAQ